MITATINITPEIQVHVEFEKFSEVESEVDAIIAWAKTRREQQEQEVQGVQFQANLAAIRGMGN